MGIIKSTTAAASGILALTTAMPSVCPAQTPWTVFNSGERTNLTQGIFAVHADSTDRIQLLQTYRPASQAAASRAKGSPSGDRIAYTLQGTQCCDIAIVDLADCSGDTISGEGDYIRNPSQGIPFS